MTPDRIKAFYLLSAKLDKLEKTPAADEKNPSPEYIQLCQAVDNLKTEYAEYVKQVNDPVEAAKADEVETLEKALGVIGFVLNKYITTHKEDKDCDPQLVMGAMQMIVNKLREVLTKKDEGEKPA